ncbi:DUF6541 family protein [Corynebacterium liangguodongii]|uniref:DUF6541 family protein n=1 Tax=Corynebacterium liangguodongii TaxID=2079535 RepID=UPI0015D0307B|nr:DUF6541 family protein [Corynebacterium liangguodongii]
MTVTGALAIALAMFVLPGFILSWVAGAKAPVALASALPVTFGVVGFSAWFWGLTSARFNLLTFTISYLIALALAAVWRWATDYRRHPAGTPLRQRLLREGWRAGSILDPAWILPAVGAVTGSVLFIGDRLGWLARTPHGLGNIVQGWDVQWHANVVRFILDEGIASPTRMGELQNVETYAQLLYPTGYHSAIAMFAQAAGLEPIPALNVASAILPGLALPVGMACLVFAMTQSRGLTTQIAAALSAIAIYAAPTVMWVPEYVGMWPYLFALCLSGIVIWQFCSLPARPETALPAVIGFIGILEVHPSAGTVVALAVFLYWATRLIFVPVRTRLQDFALIAGPALIGGLALLPQILQGSAQAEEVAEWVAHPDDATDTPWMDVLMMHTRHAEQFFPDFNATALLWLAAGGAVALIAWRRLIWPLLFFGISAAAAVNVLEPVGGPFGAVLDAIGSFHYNTAHRLVMPVSMLTVAGAAIGVAAALRLVAAAPLAVRSGSARWQKASISASLVLAIAAGAATTWWVVNTAREPARAAYVGSRADTRMVNDDDRMAFDWLATQPAAWEGLTLGEPDDGYSWLYAYNGVPTAARHYLYPVGGRGSEHDLLYWHTDFLGQGLRGDASADNPVDRAARDLNVKFILVSPENFWFHVVPRYEMLKALLPGGAATPVYQRGGTVIYAVDEAFTRAEINDMRRDAVKHGSEELPRLKQMSSAPASVGDLAGGGSAAWYGVSY